MPTYNEIDLSIDSGEPIELYEFLRTDLWQARYTTCQQQIKEGDFTYNPAPIKRSKMRQGDNALKDSVTLTLPRGHELAAEFFGAPSDMTTSITIKRMHRGMSIADSVTLWKGQASGITASDEQMEIVFQSIFVTMRRMCLSPKFELICRHPLWSAAPQCRANQPAFRVTGTVTLITEGHILTVPVASGYPNGWFTAGMIEHAGLLRTIKIHTGAIITLSRYMPGLIAGMTISLYPGCDKTKATCKNKFDNILNFGGFPWMSPKNPFDGLE